MGRILWAAVLVPLGGGCDHVPPAAPPDTPRDAALNGRRTPVDSEAATGAIPSNEPEVRVRIRRIADGKSVDITTDVGTVNIRVGTQETTVSGPGEISRKEGQWHLGGQSLPDFATGADMLELRCEAPISVGQSTGESRRYPGSIRLIATPSSDTPDGAFEVINVVSMEQYIPGVLQGELYDGWHDAAFEAQAVAARSYAMSECNQRSHRNWDVTDTAATQVYVGLSDQDSARKAAQRTRGQVLSWKKKLVPGYFSSCCGGRAATAIEAIGPNPINDVPPLRGHQRPPRCDEAPVYRWERTWDAATIADALRQWGRRHEHDAMAGIGEIVSIRPAKPNRHGRPTVAEFTDVHGARASISCIELVGVLDAAGLDSAWSGWIGADADAGQEGIEVSGRGFGHGVGLCQYGAEAMAANGSPYERILRFYYPGVEITTAW